MFRSSSSSFLIRRSWRKRALEALSLKRFGNPQADRYSKSFIWERGLKRSKIPLSQRQAFEIFIWERGLKRSKIPLSQRQAFEIFIWERGLKRLKIPLSQRQAFEIFIWERGLKRSKIPHSQRQAFEIPHRYSVAFTLLETFSFCKT